VSTIVQFWGDSITPGDKPVFIFPIVANYTSLQTRDPTNTLDNFVSTLELTGSDIDGAVSLEGTDSESGYVVGGPQETAVGGQLGNLGVRVSSNGKALKAGLGVLGEISAGIYSYTLDSTETQEPGSLLIIVKPSNPTAITDSFICSTYLNCRITKPGIPLARTTPQSIVEAITSGPNSPLSQFENYVNQALNNILGNQMTTKPTFRKDS